jgi:hypothetical protein
LRFTSASVKKCEASKQRRYQGGSLGSPHVTSVKIREIESEPGKCNAKQKRKADEVISSEPEPQLKSLPPRLRVRNLVILCVETLATECFHSGEFAVAGRAARHGSAHSYRNHAIRLTPRWGVTEVTKPCNRKRKRPSRFLSTAFINAGNDLLSHTLSRAVQSALRGLTSVFGMGTGGSPAVRSPTT